MNDFRRDDAWQKSVRDALLVRYYGKYAVEGRYVVLDRGELPTLWQKRFAVDTVAQGRAGRAVCFEEKIVRWPGYRYSAYCLETDSCTNPGRESQGWMHYGRADFLLYCFMLADRLECHLIDFARLREWFWPIHEELRPFRMEETINHSAGRLAPIGRVQAEVGVRIDTLFPDLTDPAQATLFEHREAA